MKIDLINNFNKIQEKINKILNDNEELSIHQLADLERYVNMQNTIIKTLSLINRNKGDKHED